MKETGAQQGEVLKLERISETVEEYKRRGTLVLRFRKQKQHYLFPVVEATIRALL